MGMLGEMFPGRKLRDESGEDGDGQTIGDPWDIDLDSGVIKLRPTRPPASAPQPASAPEPVSAPDPVSAPRSVPAPEPASEQRAAE